MKTAGSTVRNGEYYQRVEERVEETVVLDVAATARRSAGAVTTTEAFIKALRPEPRYKALAVVAWFLHEGLLTKAGPGRYSVAAAGLESESVEARFAALPEA